MPQSRRDADLAQEARARQRFRQLRSDDFHGDVAPLFVVVREVDESHATPTEFAQDGVPTAEGGRDGWGADVSHDRQNGGESEIICARLEQCAPTRMHECVSTGHRSDRQCCKLWLIAR